MVAHAGRCIGWLGGMSTISPSVQSLIHIRQVALGQDQPESDNPIIAVEAGRKRETPRTSLENGATLRGGNTGEFHTGLRWIGVNGLAHQTIAVNSF